MKKLLRRLWNMLLGRAPDYDITYSVEITNLDNYAKTSESNAVAVAKAHMAMLDASRVTSGQILDNAVVSTNILKEAGYNSSEILMFNESMAAMGIDLAGDEPSKTIYEVYSNEGKVFSYEL